MISPPQGNEALKLFLLEGREREEEVKRAETLLSEDGEVLDGSSRKEVREILRGYYSGLVERAEIKLDATRPGKLETRDREAEIGDSSTVS